MLFATTYNSESPIPPPPPPSGKRRKHIALALAVSLIIVLAFAVPFWWFLGQRVFQLSNDTDIHSIPTQYYVGAPRKYLEQNQNLHDLQNEVTKVSWSTLHQVHQEDVFDCSEMTAYMERFLENLGWHTIIYVKNETWMGLPHAWVLVEVNPGVATPVECTRPSVVWGTDGNYSNYFEYDYRFETIQQAMEHSPTEFDWWKNIPP
jgi:hypothetical protein